MISELVPPTSAAMPAAIPGRAVPRPPATAGPGAGAAEPGRAAGGPRAVAAPAALEQGAEAVARAVFAEREVEVTSFHDRASGRVVCTVADRRSGEILMQSPPDALLRFFASTRAMLARPLVAVDA